MRWLNTYICTYTFQYQFFFSHDTSIYPHIRSPLSEVVIDQVLVILIKIMFTQLSIKWCSKNLRYDFFAINNLFLRFYVAKHNEVVKYIFIHYIYSFYYMNRINFPLKDTKCLWGITSKAFCFEILCSKTRLQSVLHISLT